jgi:hypothetical protein
MVRATMEGRKTQTRRLQGWDEINKHPDEWIFKELVADSISHEPYARGRYWMQMVGYSMSDAVWHMYELAETLKSGQMPGEGKVH